MTILSRYILVIFCLLFFGCSNNIDDVDIFDSLDSYNIRWDSQSKNSSESMPLGGGDVGLNVWVEKGELLCYVSQSGTFDENNTMLKHGRIRVQLDPNPFIESDSFNQELVLKNGNIIISTVKDNHKVNMELWVDVHRPVVHIEVKSNFPVEVMAQYESWRTEDTEVAMNQRSQCASFSGYPGEIITYKDEIDFEDNHILWYHRNKDDKLLFDFLVHQQGLDDVEDQIYNTQIGRTFGGILSGENMKPAGTGMGKYLTTDFKSWKLKSNQPTKSQDIQLYLCTDQAPSLENWKNSLNATIKESESNTKTAKKVTHEWWKEFWEQSFIAINPDIQIKSDTAWQVGRNYQVFRYMLGCNAFGKFPSKFNGSLFTFDPDFVQQGKNEGRTPDFRWHGGGSFTAQNQRMVYWPMLKSGDFEMMRPQFDFYKNALSTAEARTKVYWGHEGCSFTEQLENFGLPLAMSWGFESGKRKRESDLEFGVRTNPFLRYHFVDQVEFSFMILEYNRFTGEDISEYMPFIKSSVKFFDEHYRYRCKNRTGHELDANGKLVIFPSSALETYKDAKNPTDVVVALQTVVERLAGLPKKYVSEEEQKYFNEFLQRIPEIPFEEKEGLKLIKPAESWSRIQNIEIPELYTVFPYARYGIGKPELDIAKNTWLNGQSAPHKRFVTSWSQVGAFAARLGLTKEAKDFVTYKLGTNKWRFPTFWGPIVDYVPDVNHGGSGMITLQEMLMQTDGKEIHLFPAWPTEWDVNFKLHAPFNTIIEGKYLNGQLESLSVTPTERDKDIVFHNDASK